jgi:hypothetical protein
MTEKQKGILLHVCTGAVIATAVAILGWTRGHSWLRMLCDGCFVAAVMLLGSGGLKFARNQGTFDMMGYSMKSVFHLHFPFAKMNSPLEEREEDFMDYKERKKAQRKPAGDLLWSGLIYLIASAVFLALYLLTAGA